MAGGKLAPKLTRRQEYAEATRKAILDAARRLFCEQGFFSTKVDDIAASARVSPATVYAVSGGKHELLQTLIEIGTTAPITTAAVAHVATIESPKAVIDGLARSCRLVREFNRCSISLFYGAFIDFFFAVTHKVPSKKWWQLANVYGRQPPPKPSRYLFPPKRLASPLRSLSPIS